MKKNLNILVAILIGGISFGQVGVNNTSPNVTLEVTAKKTDGSTSEGIIAPRLTGEALHQAELSNKYGVLQDGTIAYVTAVPSLANTVGQTISIDAKGYYYYDSTQNKWMKFRCGCDSVAGTVSTFTCASATVSGSLTANLPATSVTASIPYTGGNGGTYSAQTVPSTGVTGLTATLPAGTLANGIGGSVTYTISGTPSASGIAVFAVSLGGQNCNLRVTVGAALTSGSGSLSGKSCFDVVMVNNGADCGLLTGRLSQKADFSQTATNTQTYSFTPISAVSNVRFYYVNTNGNVITAISGGNAGTNITGAVNATVNYNTALNALASGTTRATALTANIIVVYNNNATNTGTDVQLTLQVNVQDCACCGAYIAPGVYKNFMCQNLGADMTADPFTPSAAIHGAKYQWGATTGQAGRYYSQANDQGNAGVIVGWTATGLPDGSWLDASKTVNDPCPAGYRVPTQEQWQGVISNNAKTNIGTFVNSSTNYGSAIKFGNALLLPAVGYRNNSTGTLFYRGLSGLYWSSTRAATDAYYLTFSSTSVNVNTNNRPSGFTIRCLSE